MIKFSEINAKRQNHDKNIVEPRRLLNGKCSVVREHTHIYAIQMLWDVVSVYHFAFQQSARIKRAQPKSFHDIQRSYNRYVISSLLRPNWMIRFYFYLLHAVFIPTVHCECVCVCWHLWFHRIKILHLIWDVVMLFFGYSKQTKNYGYSRKWPSQAIS